MKLIPKIIYIILAVGMCDTLAGQPVDTVPTEIRYTPPITPVNCSEELVHILSTISNAVWSADQILKTTNYTRFIQFGRTVWLESEDKTQLTVWRIAAYGTSTVVGGIQALVYQNEDMTQQDPTLSFQMSFYPETGMLQDFWWVDKHEIVRIDTNRLYLEYAKRLIGKVWLNMQWDDKGNLVSSNVYDWAVRGQPVADGKRDILEARVTLKPEALEVSPGILTAFVRLPEGYAVTNITYATCDGAPSERMMPNEDGTEMIIKFRRKDIEALLGQIGQTIDPTFIVRGTWQGPTGIRLFQGTASIKKIVRANLSRSERGSK